ncbi:50S ribosomal protein L13 [Apilactobacillus timberlakei]|uniref:Large ribosomal subunit protein uL13 n=1 Tax=Apilactobacillus timberlakei TaxID=2008380 RepID=A0ABY2YWW5_9LACO|nr:50S ribosomal protein L13 [Apilactobacillus timberlakei]TPR14920.1 50S ribosomal protein L13 [Apilactobacillus timberlakei]TPR16251.1 50S ribosomal protein L13 [Apilactobacillus timberlakei]TPR18440.1 50S ribosomal protein L13 [Apilactobacillus timberlakei]
MGYGIVCPTISPGNLYWCRTNTETWRNIKVRTTYMAKPGEVERKWYIIDATDISLGRLTSTVASILRGKNKPTFTPNVDTGDHVIVINASKVALTGRKASRKVYSHHTGYLGGLKQKTAGQMLEDTPEKLIETSVKGMMPDGSLAHKQLLHLHVHADGNHGHEAQNPEVLDINNLI